MTIFGAYSLSPQIIQALNKFTFLNTFCWLFISSRNAPSQKNAGSWGALRDETNNSCVRYSLPLC